MENGEATVKVGEQTFTLDFVQRNVSILLLLFKWFDGKARERNVDDILEMSEMLKALAVHCADVIAGRISDDSWFSEHLKGHDS